MAPTSLQHSTVTKDLQNLTWDEEDIQECPGESGGAWSAAAVNSSLLAGCPVPHQLTPSSILHHSSEGMRREWN